MREYGVVRARDGRDSRLSTKQQVQIENEIQFVTVEACRGVTRPARGLQFSALLVSLER